MRVMSLDISPVVLADVVVLVCDADPNKLDMILDLCIRIERLLVLSM